VQKTFWLIKPSNRRKQKAMDLRYYWIIDHSNQKQYFILWHKGSTNLADYFSKQYPPELHIKMYLHVENNHYRQ